MESLLAELEQRDQLTEPAQPNPFRAPATTADDPAEVSFGGTFVRFQSDWSQNGLRARWGAKRDSGPYWASFAVLSVLAAIGLLVWPSSLGLLFLVAVGTAVSWLSHLVSGQPEQFSKRNPGFAGPVRGWLSDRLVVVQGSCCGVAARLRAGDSLHGSKGITLRLPFAKDPVPISVNDQVETGIVQIPGSDGDLLDVAARNLGAEGGLRTSGTLLGNDFYWTWKYKKSSMAIASLILLGVVLLSMSVTLHRGVSAGLVYDPWGNPVAEHFGEHPTMPALRAWGVTIIGLLSLGLSGWWMLQRRSSLGQFGVVISAGAVVIDDVQDKACYAYYAETLQHFCWSEHGLVVRTHRGDVKMLIPARWFDAQQRAQIAHWFDAGYQRSRKCYYVGPLV